MKLKKLIGLIVVGAIGYFGYNYLVTNYSAEAMVYKRFASALQDSEPSRIKALVTKDGNAMEAFKAGQQRKELINGEVRFTWYTFQDKVVSQDGNTVVLTAIQHMRVDPPGQDTFYGTDVRKDRQVVVLQKLQSSWQIKNFDDAATTTYRSSQASR